MMPIQASEVVARLQALPAFPAIVTRILETLNDERAALELLEQHLQSDPVISARILSAANRLIRHSGREPVGDVHTAVSYLGLNRVHDVVVSTSLLDFAKNSHCTSVFWERSLAVGLCAQELAGLAGENPDHALVAGLLHGVGILWLQVCHPHEYQQVLIEQQLRDSDLAQTERALLGIDHLEIGRLLAEHWDLPGDIVQAIAGYRTPAHGALPPLVAVVHLATVICSGLDLPFQPDSEVRHLAPQALRALGEDWEDKMPDLLGRVEVRFAQSRTLLK
ncbi:MAG: HDOD domain-containing protein [Hylemonella sp.]